MNQFTLSTNVDKNIALPEWINTMQDENIRILLNNEYSAFAEIRESFIHEHRGILNWKTILEQLILSEIFIRDHCRYLDWDSVSQHQILSETFISVFSAKVNWDLISKYQTLSKAFIMKFANDVNWDQILNNTQSPDIDLEFIKKYANSANRPSNNIISENIKMSNPAVTFSPKMKTDCLYKRVVRLFHELPFIKNRHSNDELIDVAGVNVSLIGNTDLLHDFYTECSMFLNILSTFKKCKSVKSLHAKISQIEDTIINIRSHLKDNPDQIFNIKHFVTYYLPTARELLQEYLNLENETIIVDNVSEAKNEIIQSLDLFNQSFKSILNDLHQDNYLNISTNISVFKTKCAQDGLLR